MHHIAIIPARGGSKRIPKKNIRDFNGAPIISYAIKNAINSNLFDRVIVSTDDAEIEKIAKTFGAEVPFIRSKELSGDATPTVPVIRDAILRVSETANQPAFVTAIYPCTPLLNPSDLTLAFSQLQACDASYVFPVCVFPSPPERGLRLNTKMETKSVDASNAWTRTQDIEDMFYDAGQFYCGRTSSWLDQIELHNQSRAIILPAWRAIDIDTDSDWTQAEQAHKLLSNLGS